MHCIHVYFHEAVASVGRSVSTVCPAAEVTAAKVVEGGSWQWWGGGLTKATGGGPLTRLPPPPLFFLRASPSLLLPCLIPFPS